MFLILILITSFNREAMAGYCGDGFLRGGSSTPALNNVVDPSYQKFKIAYGIGERVKVEGLGEGTVVTTLPNGKVQVEIPTSLRDLPENPKSQSVEIVGKGELSLLNTYSPKRGSSQLQVSDVSGSALIEYLNLFVHPCDINVDGQVFRLKNEGTPKLFKLVEVSENELHPLDLEVTPIGELESKFPVSLENEVSVVLDEDPMPYRILKFHPETKTVSLVREFNFSSSDFSIFKEKPDLHDVLLHEGQYWKVSYIHQMSYPRIYLTRVEEVEISSRYLALLDRRGQIKNQPIVRHHYQDTGISRVGSALVFESQADTTTDYVSAGGFTTNLTHLKDKLKKLKETEQAMVSAVIDHKWTAVDDIDSVSYEKVTSIKAVSRGGKKLILEFSPWGDNWVQSVIEESIAFAYSFSTQNRAPHPITVLIAKPKNPKDLDRVRQKIEHFLKGTPKILWDQVHVMKINPARALNLDSKTDKLADACIWQNFSGTQKGGITNFYRIPQDQAIDDIFPISFSFHNWFHEGGHHAAQAFFQLTTPPPHWLTLALKDGRFVSDYAHKNLAEDFAETFAVYIMSDAGRLDPSQRALYPNRFQYLDEMMDYFEHH